MIINTDKVARDKLKFASYLPGSTDIQIPASKTLNQQAAVMNAFNRHMFAVIDPNAEDPRWEFVGAWDADAMMNEGYLDFVYLGQKGTAAFNKKYSEYAQKQHEQLVEAQMKRAERLGSPVSREDAERMVRGEL